MTIASYSRNPDGSVTFKDETGMTVLNAPADNPMTQGKMAELGPSAEAPNAMGQPPGPPGMQPPGGKPGGASPYGSGPAGPGFQAATSRGLHNMMNGLAPKPPGANGPIAPPPGMYPGAPPMPGQGPPPGPPPQYGPRDYGTGAFNAQTAAPGSFFQANDRTYRVQGPEAMDPKERQAYADTQARLRQAAEDEERATRHPGPDMPMRKPLSGERIDPATGAVLPAETGEGYKRFKDREDEGYGG